MNESISSSNTSLKAASPALIQGFTIERLYGYRTISLSSQYAATILIAKNGTGKTTLLGALDAFLKLQLSRLRDLPFSTIRARIRGVEKEIVLTHDDVIDFLRVPDDGDLARLAVRIGSEPAVLFEYFINNALQSARHDRIVSSEHIGMNLRRAFNYNYAEMESAVENVRAEIFSRQPNILYMWNSLRRILDDTEIVYLPTYRRVELALRDEVGTDSFGRSKGPKFLVAAGSLYPGDIQFGLADIQERLRSLNNSIIGSSNNGYRKISANIISDLLDGSFANQTFETDDLPSKEELSLFFDRIKDGRRTHNYEAVTVPNLEKLAATSDLPDASRQFLSYFLGQLGQVIDTSKDAEEPVTKFVNICNKYLSSAEPSTEIDNCGDNSNADSKALRLNRKNLSVHVENISTGRRILLNALSSGEKQMISLFAKLFLYPKRKVVLIDEPELSLSIDWQSQILVDVLDAPLCEQVIAITHSPFVFENELDPFARPLRIKLEPQEPQEINTVDDAANGFDDDAE